MTSSRALELVHKLEQPDDVGIQLNVVNAPGDCPIAKADIIAILKEFATIKDAIDEAKELIMSDTYALPYNVTKEYMANLFNKIEGKKVA